MVPRDLLLQRGDGKHLQAGHAAVNERAFLVKEADRPELPAAGHGTCQLRAGFARAIDRDG